MTATTESQKIKNFLLLNLSVLLISTSGPLGRFVTLPPPLTIALRAGLACVLLFLYCKWMKFSFRLERKVIVPVVVSGLFLGLHWVTYFYALQWSTVAIGMLSMYTYPVITAFMEPILLKTAFQKFHILLGVLVLVGILLLVPEFDFQNSYTRAIAMGITSAFCYSLRNIIMKKHATNYQGSVTMTYQLMMVLVLFIPVWFMYDLEPIVSFWKPILALAIITTAIGHTLFLQSFKHFSVTTASIISSAQPVYGIIAGILFLDEIPAWTTVIGGALILSSVFVENFRSYRSS